MGNEARACAVLLLINGAVEEFRTRGFHEVETRFVSIRHAYREHELIGWAHLHHLLFQLSKKGTINVRFAEVMFSRAEEGARSEPDVLEEIRHLRSGLMTEYAFIEDPFAEVT
jgi:hypothetical protein